MSAGSASFMILTTRSWLPPGTAQRRLTLRSCSACSDMGEDVLLGPAGEVEQGAVRQAGATSVGERGAGRARPPFGELLLQRVEIAHVGGGIILLGVAQFRSAPVRALLLLGDIL